MGKTHFRSDVKEEGTRKLAFTNASLVVATIGTLKVTGNTTVDGTSTLTGNVGVTGTVTGTGGVIVGSGKYVKLGSVYIISGSPTAFTKAALHALATSAIGATLAAAVPRGSLLLNASSNLNATQAAYVKIAPASWMSITTGSKV